MIKSRLNLLLWLFVSMLAFTASSCGSTDPNTERTVGPTGPSTSGYYFNLSVTPSSISAGSKTFTFIKSYVWDTNGTPVSGIAVGFAAESTATVDTDSTGLAEVYFEIDPGTVTMGAVYFTASMEDLELTNYVQVTPN